MNGLTQYYIRAAKRPLVKRLVFVFLVGVALNWCWTTMVHSAEDPEGESESARVTRDSPLYDLDISLDRTEKERAAFKKEFLALRKLEQVRPLYEKYIDRIGANGIIFEVEGWKSTCHGPGHPLGMVIFSKLGKIRPALRTCRDACNSGCMHGVFMESFAPAHEHQHSPEHGKDVNYIVPTVKAQIGSICSDEVLSDLYKPGDCAHGVGHAVMHIVDYDIPRAMENCRLFGTYPMQYYCATGGYMQYVNDHDEDDSKNKPLFYPCDTHEYPAACFRYKMVHVMRRNYQAKRNEEEIAKKCMALQGKFRLGCFHGLGNAHMGSLWRGLVSISVVCRFGTDQDQYACIDGAVERLGKYHPEMVEERCQALAGWRRDLCLDSGRRGMYALDKSFKYYPQ